MPFILEIILLFTIGLLGPILLFRWFMQKYIGRDDGTLDRVEGYGRGWGDAHWRQMNEHQAGEAEKIKSYHDFDGARIQASPTPMHIPDTSRLAINEKADASEPVSLSDLLRDDKQQNKKR